jgi:hypothetical protein
MRSSRRRLSSVLREDWTTCARPKVLDDGVCDTKVWVQVLFNSEHRVRVVKHLRPFRPFLQIPLESF